MRAFTDTYTNEVSCYIGMIFIAFCLRVFVTPFFAVFVYVHVLEAQVEMEHDIVFLTFSWVTALLGLSFISTEVISVDGSCSIELSLSNFFTSFVLFVLLLLVLALCTVVLFSILSYCHVKRNIILSKSDGSRRSY